MPTYNLFSKRQKALIQEPSDILVYDVLPQTIRVQFIHIISDSIGIQRSGRNGHEVEEAYKAIHDVLAREYGLFILADGRNYEAILTNFIMNEPNVDRVLDAVELCMKFLDHIPNMELFHFAQRKMNAEEAVEELNERFRENAIGFQFENDQIIRVDSTYIHKEIVKPTLRLLFNPKFAGANEEYLKAHEHYRHGRNKECLTECLKAFESTMKIICTLKGWSFNATDTAKPLINIILTNNLIPAYMQSQISAFRSILESGIPTIRNKIGGHGQGATRTTADDETTRYTLNLTGSNLIYLIELSGL